MTKEEIEKEAEDNKPPYAFCALDTKCELWKDGFQKGAEPREKRIEELEAQIEKMKCCENCAFQLVIGGVRDSHCVKCNACSEWKLAD